MRLRNARFFIGMTLMLGCAWAHGMNGPAPGGGGEGTLSVIPASQDRKGG